MSDFFNTLDLLGDNVVLDSLITRTITEYKDNVITNIAGRAFEDCYLLETLDLPNLVNLGGYTMISCKALADVNLPNIQNVGSYDFASCTSLQNLDFPKVTKIGASSFMDTALTKLILRSEELCSLANVNSFNGTPIKNGTGYIYVPRALAESYKVATNWSTFADQFRALEDYTVDGTITGELDESKI